jgi:hypothetical protein
MLSFCADVKLWSLTLGVEHIPVLRMSEQGAKENILTQKRVKNRKTVKNT